MRISAAAICYTESRYPTIPFLFCIHGIEPVPESAIGTTVTPWSHPAERYRRLLSDRAECRRHLGSGPALWHPFRVARMSPCPCWYCNSQHSPYTIRPKRGINGDFSSVEALCNDFYLIFFINMWTVVRF